MRWTALSLDGSLVRFDGHTATFGAQSFTTQFFPYVPVAASDGNLTLVVARDGLTDAVWYLDSRGQQAQIGSMTVGKWPLAIVRLGPGRFRAAWISSKGLDVLTVADFTNTATGFTFTTTTRPMPEIAAVLVTMDANGGFTLDNVDAGYAFKSYTRAGLEIPLIYSMQVGGRVVGVDGRPGPNQVLLGDADGWFLVSATDASAQFPPRLDKFGNVATFEGDYFTNANIRERVIVRDASLTVAPAMLDDVDDKRALVIGGLLLIALYMLDE